MFPARLDLPSAIALLFLVIVFFSVVGLYSALERRRHPGPRGPREPWKRWQPGDALPPRPTAHDILRERFARGEVNVDDFEQLAAALGPDPYNPPNG